MANLGTIVDLTTVIPTTWLQDVNDSLYAQKVYATKAAANAVLSGQSVGLLIEVTADESLSAPFTNSTALYRVTAGPAYTLARLVATTTNFASRTLVQNCTFIDAGTTGGSANAQTFTQTPAPSAYVDGQGVTAVAGFTNTGAMTLNGNGLGAVNVQALGASLTAGMVTAGNTYHFVKRSTAWHLLNPTLSVAMATTLGVSRANGLSATNNSGTPNTQFDITASKVALADSTGAIVVVNSPGTLTNNISTAGPVANGRDQAGAFTDPSFIHFYLIHNGTTYASLSSASATAPTLPSGYTYSGYVGAVYFTGGALRRTYINGKDVYIAPFSSVLSGGTATSETAVSVSTVVPANATGFTGQFHITSSSGGGIATFRALSGNNYFQMQVHETGSFQYVFMEMQNLSQQFLYLVNVSTISASVNINGYKLPNIA